MEGRGGPRILRQCRSSPKPLLLRGKGPLFTNVCTKQLQGFKIWIISEKIAKKLKRPCQDSNLQYRQPVHDAVTNQATEEANKD